MEPFITTLSTRGRIGAQVTAGVALVLAASALAVPQASAQPVPAAAVQAAPMARAAAGGSTILFQCGTNVCRIDPDRKGSRRVVTKNAVAAGISRDGRTGQVLNRANNVIRRVALARGGSTRRVVDFGSRASDRPDHVTLSDSGTYAGWRWYYPPVYDYTPGSYYAATIKPGDRKEYFQVSSIRQFNIGWWGDTLVNARRGLKNFDGTGYPSRICVGPDGGDSCPNLFASESDYNIHMAQPDMHPAGQQAVVIRAAEPQQSGYGLPYYGSLALYNKGATRLSKVLLGGSNANPEYSADGKRIVFERKGKGIWVINTNGRGLRKITNGTLPFWGGGPNGSAVAIGTATKVGTTVKFVLTCPAVATNGCRGSYALRTVKKYRLGGRKATVLVASGSGTIPRGTKVLVTRPLTAKARKLFTKNRSVKVRITVKPKGAPQSSATRTLLR